MKYIITGIFFFYISFLFAQGVQEVKSALEFQETLNENYKDSEKSPLKADDLKTFEGHEFFPVDTSFYIVAEFVRTPFETPFEMPTNTERTPSYVKYGEAYFHLGGKEYKLNLYQNLELSADSDYRDYLFLPFTDETNGISTYAGGRYIDLSIPVANTIVIDFNRAYNPYCAYNGKYSCPIPPEENDIHTEVTAGVKDFH